MLSGKLASSGACGQTQTCASICSLPNQPSAPRAGAQTCARICPLAKLASSGACGQTQTCASICSLPNQPSAPRAGAQTCARICPLAKLASSGACGQAQTCASICPLTNWLSAARVELPDSAFSPFGYALRRSARACALWQTDFRRREWNFQIPHSHHSGMPSAGAREHVPSGKLTFGGASGTSRFHIPAIRVCPPQERASMCSLASWLLAARAGKHKLARAFAL